MVGVPSSSQDDAVGPAADELAASTVSNTDPSGGATPRSSGSNLDPSQHGPPAGTASTSLAPEDVQATFCATIVDEWVRLGVRHAVVSPGSRSTPVAVELSVRHEITVHVVHDERVAGFVALGLGSSSVPACPALLLCTSGTAAANFLPAVVEAGLSEIPMIVVTADRPEELRGVGAPQTIDQQDLYGSHVRWFCDPGVPDASRSWEWRAVAAAAWEHATAGGPIQLNLPFREPLLGTAATLPPARDAEAMTATTHPDPGPVTDAAGSVAAELARERGIILAGGLHGQSADDVAALSEESGWPVIADPTSRLRHLAGTVTTADALVRIDGFARDHAPEIVVRLGRPPASKVISQWIVAAGAPVVQVGGPGVIDPDHNVIAVCELDELRAARPGRAGATPWREAWQLADQVADRAVAREIAATCASGRLTEPAVARLVAEHRPPGSDITVASSMPVRDLEWYGGRQAAAHANRGANGIDGVVSTALGRALAAGPSAAPTVVLVGDLAFVHDVNALVGLSRRAVDLRVVVVDNDGGGIFSFLPQASALGSDRFETLFGTPLATDVTLLAQAHGIDVATVETADELIGRLARPGPSVTRIGSDRTRNVADHAAVHAAVAAAVANARS